jgi:hypothetical protein
MIVNPDSIKDLYKCKEQVMRYLTYKCHIPILSYDKDYYYFVYNSRLKDALKKMPLGIKLQSYFKT